MNSLLTLTFIFLSLTLVGQDSFPSYEELATSAATDSLENAPVFEGYYSNYFSFHGQDSLGKVYFAIDNNRQKTEKSYKANNFLYFNADGEWKKLKGHDKYKSTASSIEKIPSSEHFEFLYKENELTGIDSPSNEIQLDFLKPLDKAGEYGGDGMLFEIYTTEATLKYKDRILKGNVISERLIDSVGLKTFGNMMKVVFGGFEFDGYYLNVEGLGDLYVHLVESKAAVGIFKDNIYNLNTGIKSTDYALQRSNYTVTKSKRVGFKKLPLEIEIDLPDCKLTLRTTHFQKYRNLLVFAFGMGSVEGELLYEGKTYPVYGLSELFEF